MTVVIFLVLAAVVAVFLDLRSVFSPASQLPFFLPSSLGLFPALSQTRAPVKGLAMNSDSRPQFP
jgi:hypothetical protein